MKAFILAIALTCVAAVPSTNVKVGSERIVDQVVATALREHFAKVAEHDPVVQAIYAGGWDLPDGPDVLNVNGYVSGVNAAGFSNLVQNSITYDLWTGEFGIDLAFPSVTGSVARAYGEVNIFDRKLSASGSGSIVVTGVRGVATAIVALGAEGVVISDINAELYLADVNASLDLVVVNRDIGGRVTDFLNKLPEYSVEYKNQITNVVNYVAQWWINRRQSEDDEDESA